MTCL